MDVEHCILIFVIKRHCGGSSRGVRDGSMAHASPYPLCFVVSPRISASGDMNDYARSRMKRSLSGGGKAEAKEKPRIRTLSTTDILASHKGEGGVRYMQSEGGLSASKLEGEGREFIWRLWRGGRVEVTCGSSPLYEIRHRGMTIV